MVYSMTWLLAIFQWILNALPLKDILQAFINFLRKEAAKTDNKIDDEAVDFLEMVFQSLGWISTDAGDVSPPVTLTADVSATASKAAKVK